MAEIDTRLETQLVHAGEPLAHRRRGGDADLPVGDLHLRG